MSTEEQLLSFFAYSMFIYPVTNWLVSPQRTYSRWKGAVYAIMFLGAISLLHVVHENREKGPNHYELLNVPRGHPSAALKKSFKKLSLELHPDKNKSPEAVEQFRRVKQAYEVLSNRETKRTYNLFGDDGVKVSAQSVIDRKYIIIQMLVYYISSAIFAFMMTMSEPSGDAMKTSFFGLACVLLLESYLVLEEYEPPNWLLPYMTPHDMVSLTHRLFPAFMNGCRCIFGAFYIDSKAVRLEALSSLAETTKSLTYSTLQLLKKLGLAGSRSTCEVAPSENGGIISAALSVARLSQEKDSALSRGPSSSSSDGNDSSNRDPNRTKVAAAKVDNNADSIVHRTFSSMKDPVALRRSNEQSFGTEWIRNLALYLIIRAILAKPLAMAVAEK